MEAEPRELLVLALMEAEVGTEAGARTGADGGGDRTAADEEYNPDGGDENIILLLLLPLLYQALPLLLPLSYRCYFCTVITRVCLYCTCTIHKLFKVH